MCPRSCTRVFSEPTYGLNVSFVYVYETRLLLYKATTLHHVKVTGMVRRGWNTKHHMVTTIRRTAAHLYHTVNHYRVHLPHGASITQCTSHTLHGSRFLNYHTALQPKFFTYHTVHLPCGAWTQVPQLPHSAPTQALHAPTTQCTNRQNLTRYAFFPLLFR